MSMTLLLSPLQVYRPGQVSKKVTVHRILLHGPKGEKTIEDEMVKRNMAQENIDAATSN